MGWIIRTWSKSILLLSRIKFETQGYQNLNLKSHYFFAANHTSAFDIPIVFAALPFQMVAISKIELKYIPIFGWAMQAGGHIFVDRRNHHRAMNSMEKAKKSMSKNPRSVIIFPEGTRSKDGKILPFKKGGLVLAISLGMPIIPIGIIGTRSLLKDKFSSISKNTVKLVLGEPIETKNLTYDDRNDLAINLRQEVAKLIEN